MTEPCEAGGFRCIVAGFERVQGYFESAPLSVKMIEKSRAILHKCEIEGPSMFVSSKAHLRDLGQCVIKSLTYFYTLSLADNSALR